MSNLVIHLIAKSTFTFTNFSKIGHILEIYHNWKKEVVIVSIAIMKSIKPIT